MGLADIDDRQIVVVLPPLCKVSEIM